MSQSVAVTCQSNVLLLCQSVEELVMVTCYYVSECCGNLSKERVIMSNIEVSCQYSG